MGVKLFECDGAVVMGEMKIQQTDDGETQYVFPKVNDKYKIAMIKDEMLYASKDGINFGIAIAVQIDGQSFTRKSLQNDCEKTKEV